MEQKNRDKEWHERLRGEIAHVVSQYNQFVTSRIQHNYENNSFKAISQEKQTSAQERKLAHGLQSIFDRLNKGFQNIISHIKEVHENDPGLLDLNILTHISEMMAVATIIDSQQNVIVEHVSQGQCLQDACGISDKGIESLYQAGKYFYEQQLYEEASIVFTILSLIQPTQAIFWVGLGNSEYFLSRYKQALMAYSLASQVDSGNPRYYIFSAKCHKAMGNKGGALSCLNLAELAPHDRAAQDTIRKLIQPMIREIEAM